MDQLNPTNKDEEVGEIGNRVATIVNVLQAPIAGNFDLYNNFSRNLLCSKLCIS